MAAKRLTMGHYQRGGLTYRMLITALSHIWLEGHQETRNDFSYKFFYRRFLFIIFFCFTHFSLICNFTVFFLFFFISLTNMFKWVLLLTAPSFASNFNSRKIKQTLIVFIRYLQYLTQINLNKTQINKLKFLLSKK